MSVQFSRLDLAKFLTALFTIGLAYGVGIVVALVVCTATSGGHFSPAVTIIHALFNGFPPTKTVRLVKAKWRSAKLIYLRRYIIAQILGGFFASWFVYWQWRTLIKVSIYAAAVFSPEYF